MKTIKQMLAGMALFFKNLFNNIPGWVERAAPAIFAVTSKIREILEKGQEMLESEMADLIVKAIPGTWDDALRSKLLGLLQQAIPVVINLEDCNGDLGCMLKTFLLVLQKETPAAAKGKLMVLASKMLALQDEGKLEGNQYDFLMQAAYSKKVA